ncbi:unnamed protein product [Mytilus edulis]|uniref:Uncharacterized protein n=1 Tax=Mytilus edulis TaxID=6550 RepID=A0A8S3Q1E7_MYTED|nr:unnamed protein product [Mytilus edulis]
MTETLDFKIVFILLLSSNLSWILAKSTDENRAKILNKMKNDFRDIRIKNQYAALYVPPPNSKAGVIFYVPRKPEISRGNVIYPEVDDKNIKHYPQNYAGSTVDTNGTRYWERMKRPENKTIHTEDLLLNLVIPGLFDWYKVNFKVKSVSAVYLYTYFLPCPGCFEIIESFVNRHSGVPLYVGYTQLFGGMREAGDKDKESKTRKRRNDLNIFLKGKNGILLQVDDSGICHQPGVESRLKGISLTFANLMMRCLLLRWTLKVAKPRNSARRDNKAFEEKLKAEAEEEARVNNIKVLYYNIKLLTEIYKKETDILPWEEFLAVDCKKPSTGEIKKVIKMMKNNKAPDPYNVPAEALKVDIETSTQMLYELFGKIWEEEEIPVKWREGDISKLPKKGNLSI